MSDTSVDLNIIFTGICSYALGKIDSSRTWTNEVRFLMPNTKRWRQSVNEPRFLIPPHQPFLIARETEVALKSNRKGKLDWKGRRPTGRLLDRWVYWMLKDETLRVIEDRPLEPAGCFGVKLGNTKNVAKLYDICGNDATLDDNCFTGRSRRVATRFIFHRGRLSQRGLTAETFAFDRCAGGETEETELADELQVTLKAVPVNDDGEIVISTRRLDDDDEDDEDTETRRRDSIILAPKRALLDIYAGSAPEIDLGAVVGAAPNHYHGNANLHFELHYDMARNPNTARPVPKVKRRATTGPIGGTDRCPPTLAQKPAGS